MLVHALKFRLPLYCPKITTMVLVPVLIILSIVLSRGACGFISVPRSFTGFRRFLSAHAKVGADKGPKVRSEGERSQGVYDSPELYDLAFSYRDFTAEVNIVPPLFMTDNLYPTSFVQGGISSRGTPQACCRRPRWQCIELH